MDFEDASLNTSTSSVPDNIALSELEGIVSHTMCYPDIFESKQGAWVFDSGFILKKGKNIALNKQNINSLAAKLLVTRCSQSKPYKESDDMGARGIISYGIVASEWLNKTPVVITLLFAFIEKQDNSNNAMDLIND